MSAAAVLAVVVAVGDGQGALAGALAAAAAEALAPVATIELREVEIPSDDAAVRVEQELGARGVVKLVWMDTAHEEVRIRLHVARNDHWSERMISFASADTLTERGRALGFAIASMLPEAAPELVPEGGISERPPPESTLSPWALGLTAVAGTGIGGPATGVGGAADVEWFASRTLSVRLIAGARRGSVPDFQATDFAGFGGVGVAVWVVPPTIDQHLGLAIRSDLLALYHLISRTRPSGQPERRDRLLPAADLLLEVSWLFGTTVELLASGGTEVAFGLTELGFDPDAPPLATIPAFRAVAQGGLRLRF